MKCFKIYFGNISLIVIKFDYGFYLNVCVIVMKNKKRLKKKIYKKSIMVFIFNIVMMKISKNCFFVFKLLIFCLMKIEKFFFYFIILVV